MRKSVLLNAANLHVGGGVQVASSLLSEICRLEPPDLRIGVIASAEVDRQVRAAGVDLSVFASYSVLDVFGWSRGSVQLRRAIANADLVFTVFGPLYQWRKPKISIVGFAQAWIVYPSTEAYALLSLPDRLKARAKFWLQRCAFVQGSDLLLVEARHVANRLSELHIFPREYVRVVPNTLNGVYFTPETWKRVDCGPRRLKTLRLGLISRDYPHKNLAILPEIKAALNDRYGIDAEFFVTLTALEWAKRGERFRSSVVNVGPLASDQCPAFYEQMDAVIFPSLLECFSATPLEAMYMRKPLFASDRSFVRDMCGNHAQYFDPTSAEDAARKIAQSALPGFDPTRIEEARNYVLTLPGPRQRAVAYLDEITRLLRDK